MAEELGSHDDDPGLRILDDVQHLRWREPPIHRHANGTQLGEAADDFEEFGAVLLDEGDPIAEADTGRPERLGGLAGPRVELRERDGPFADDQRRRRRAEAARGRARCRRWSRSRVGHGQLLGCSALPFHHARSTAPGATLFTAWAVTAIRGAIRTGRTRAAVIIQSAASSALNPGRPSYARVGAIIGVSTSG